MRDNDDTSQKPTDGAVLAVNIATVVVVVIAVVGFIATLDTASPQSYQESCEELVEAGLLLENRDCTRRVGLTPQEFDGWADCMSDMRHTDRAHGHCSAGMNATIPTLPPHRDR